LRLSKYDHLENEQSNEDVTGGKAFFSLTWQDIWIKFSEQDSGSARYEHPQR
jgi:hypothetical protein